MALANLPSLLDVVENPTLLLKLPAHLAQEYVDRLRQAVRDMGSADNVPPDPIAMAVANPRYRWMEAPHLRYLSDEISATIDENGAAVVTMPPRHAKPVSVDELVLLKNGHRARLGDVQIGDEVLTHRGRFRPVEDIIERPSESVLRIKTWHGRTVVATPDHPFLTPRGWMLAATLRPGDVLGTPIPEPTDAPTQDVAATARLAGYFVGDGCTTGNAASITCFDDLQAADMIECASALGFDYTPATGRTKAGRHNFSGGVRSWLRDNPGLVGNSRTKRVPQFVFDGGREAARNFIAGYFACDGHVQNRGAQRKSSQRRDFVVEITSVNRALVEDVQHLLLRLGIRSRIRHRSFVTNFSNGVSVDSYHCIMTSQDDVDRFRREIPVRGVKAQRLAALNIERQAFDPEILPDSIVSIEDAGIVDCRCLTVADDHSFTANDIAVHNTHTCSVWTPFWFLARRPDAHVLLISYTLEFARKWGVKVRSLIETYGKDYGLVVDPKKSAGHDWELTSGGGMKTVGVGGGIAGNPVKLLIGDDLLKDMEDGASEVIREKTWEWWEATVIQRIEPDTSTILIGTRYHEDDIIGRVLKASANGTGLKFREITLRAKAEVDDPLDRPIGEGLWPSHHGWGQEFYDKREREVSPYVWHSVFQQRPSPPGGNKVDPAWWRFCHPSQLPPVFDQEIQSWDLALDAKLRTDSFQCGGILSRRGASIFIRDAYHEHSPIAAGVDLESRLPTKSVVTTIRNWTRIYPGARQKLVERSLAGPMLVGTLHHEVGGMLAWPPKGRQKSSKDALLEAIIPAIRAGNVYLPLNPDGSKPRWVQELIEECRQFPNGAHDDYVDMLTQGVTFLLPDLRRAVETDQFAAKHHLPDTSTPQQQHTHALHALLGRLAKPKLDEMKRQQRLAERGILPFGRISTDILSTARSGGRRRRTGMW